MAPSLPTDLPVAGRVRHVRDADAHALAALIGGIYAEYPGCVLDLDGVDADLTTPASTIAAKDGEWIVVESPDGDRLTATIGWAPAGPGAVELKRLYVRASARGAGLGTRLVAWVERRAREAGADRVELWSDTRFEAAHRLYERRGYQRRAETRALHDPSDTIEAAFVKPL